MVFLYEAREAMKHLRAARDAASSFTAGRLMESGLDLLAAAILVEEQMGTAKSVLNLKTQNEVIRDGDLLRARNGSERCG